MNLKFMHLPFLLLFVLISHLSKAQTVDSVGFYPNPVFDKAFFTFKLSDRDTVSLVVYNLEGVKVKEYLNETILPAGTYKIEFKGSDYPVGMFVCVLTTGTDESQNIKVIVTGNGLNPIQEKAETGYYYDVGSQSLVFSDAIFRKLEFYNINGQLIESAESESEIFSVTDLPEGVYIFRIIDINDKVTGQGKIVKR
jgi:hypothetical protein